jgi:hypothetical protein
MARSLSEGLGSLVMVISLWTDAHALRGCDRVPVLFLWSALTCSGARIGPMACEMDIMVNARWACAMLR